MNRIQLFLTALLGALMPLVFDSALKGAALLAAAALCALILYKASAATRHLVWLVAVLALLIVPVLSFALPQWRILPQWTTSPLAETVTPAAPPPRLTEETREIQPAALSPLPSAAPIPLISAPPLAGPGPQVLPVPLAQPAPAVPDPARTWRDWLPLAWATGFAFLALRLLAAHLLLRRAARRCTALTAPPDEFIAATFATALAHLGIRQRVTLLVDEKRTIPVVWGVFRPRLMLPAEAREWSSDQLRSVFLHELAHIKRRDMLVQWITQIACALHWFNPLVWLAAWRLHAERERACDDLVLASGVRPSAYAEHLLHVATRLSPARWTAACGLAMARKSSLEGRLLAVLSEKLNRRGITRALTAAALLLAAAVAIPIAMLRAAVEKTDAKTGARLQPDTAAKLKWGEPVNGLRMALAWPPTFDDAVLGKDPCFQLVVQNVSEKEVRFTASDDAPNPRTMRWREGERIVSSLNDQDAQKADWQLHPGECGVLRMFSKEERNKDGRTVSAGLEGDLAGGTRYHVIAVMEVAKAPEGAWTGKLTSGQTRGSADAAAAPAPKHKDARAIYEIWLRHARANGDIPGALIGDLAAAVKTFIGYNPTWETVPKLNALLPRLDATRDWKPADAIALLDEVAAVQDSPLQTAAEKATRQTIRKGEALPKKFADVPWGDAQPNGLRAAWLLEPGAAEHRMGAALKARLLVQNTGSVPVMARVPTWHQGWVKANDAKGAEVEASGISWTTLAQLVPVRLGPGEYIEINTPGVGLGPRAGMEPWAGPRVGSNVLAKPGDELTLTHGLVPLDGSEVGVREDDPHIVGPGWWEAHIKTRLARELPLPADAAERLRLLDDAVRELFATAPTSDESAAFIADKTPNATDALVKRLAARTDVVEFSGKLEPAPAKFRVLAADPADDKMPRVVLGPGEYPVGAGATLKIVGRPDGERRVNDTKIIFEAREATGKLAPEPHKLEVPDGWGTWAIVCRPNDGFFYVLHKGGVRKIDYSNPAKVTDMPANDLPGEFRDEVKRQLEIHEISESEQAEILETAATPAETPAPLPGLSPAFTADSIVKAEANTFRLSGNVRLRTDSVAVDADEMTVVPAGPGEKDAGKNKGIGTLTARGNVRVMFKDEASKVTFVQGGAFDWNASTGAVVVKEQPVLQAGNRQFAGTKPDSSIEFNSGRDELYMSGMDKQVLGPAATPFTADQFPGTSSTRIPDPAKPGPWSGYHANSMAEGKSSVTVLHPPGEDPVVIVVTGRAARVPQGSTARAGSLTMDVATSEKTITIRYTWPEDASGFLDLKTGGYPVSRFDLSRGRVFFVHFEKLEFSADIFQVPAGVKVPFFSLSDDNTNLAVAAVTNWYAASDDRARWECSRVVVPEGEYKAGQPLGAAAEKIVWGEVNDVGLRLGLGGLEPGASFPVGQQLPVKQYIRNDSAKAITFSPTQIFNEGVGGELVRKADGKKFPHKKGYPWQGFFHRVRLAPGHYIALGSGPMRTTMAEKDGSSPGGMDMMAHGFTVLPGEYTLQLTHDIGQFQGRPVNFHFGDPRGAPGLGEWTGVLKSAAVPLRLVDEQVKTARAGGSEAFGRYMIAFDKGVLKLRHYNGYPNMARVGGPWEDRSRDWKIPAADGEYVAAWAVGGKGLWVKDASGITHLIVKENLTETGRWTLDQASGGLGGMPAGVRAALQLPPAAAPQPFDFKKLPNAPGAAKISGDFFEMALSPGTVLKVPHGRREFFIENGGSAYGPAEGNPVVELGLTELLRARLTETPNTAGLDMLRHMIADGRGAIRDCGFRLLADLKAPQAPFDYDAVFHAMIHASIEDEDGPRELTPEARTGYTWFHNLFHTTRLEWERTRPLLAAGRYQPGEALGADTAIVWTPGPDGLSLGVSGLPAGTNLEIGKSVPVAVYLRNDSTAPVKLSVPAEHNPVIQISLTDAAGKTHRAIYPFSAPLTGYSHHELAPGTGAKVAAFDLEACATPEEANRAEHKEGKPHNPRLAVPAGSYELHLEYRNYQENPVPKGAASEWTGKLSAKPVPMKVAAAASGPDPNAEKAPLTAIAPGRYVLGENAHLLVSQVTEGDKRTNKAVIEFLSPDPKVASPHKPYEIELEEVFAFVWEPISQKLWVTDISEGQPIPVWLGGAKDLPGPKKVMVRAFDFTDPADVKLTHISTSENGGGWSWAKLIPKPFQAPVIQALGEKGNRLQDFVAATDLDQRVLPVIPRRWPAELKEAEQKAQELSQKLKQGAKLTPPMLQGVWKGADEKNDFMVRLTFGVPSPGKVRAEIEVPYPRTHMWKLMNHPFGYVLTLEQDGDAVKFASCDEEGLPSHTVPTDDKRAGPVGGKISVSDGGALVLVMPAYILKDKLTRAPDGTESWSIIREYTGSDVSIPLHPLTIFDQASLEGSWEGEKDGVTVRTKIAWNDGKPEMDWWSSRDGQVVKERMHLALWSDRDQAAVQLEKDRHHPAPAGLYPGPEGTLRLTINKRTGSWQASVPEYPAVKDLVLVKQAGETPAKSETSEKPSGKGVVKTRPGEFWVNYFKGADDNPTEPFDPGELARLAKDPTKSPDGSRLRWLLYRAAVEKDARFRHLLEEPALKNERMFTLPLAAYDYSVNGNQDGLKFILEALGKVKPGSDSDEIFALGFLDEWDLTIAAYEKYFAGGKDGAAGAGDEFWSYREIFFPRQFEQYHARKAALQETGKSNSAEHAQPDKAAGDVRQRRKVDWSKPPQLSFFEGKYDPELLARLAGKPEKLNEDSEAGTKIWPLSEQILRAAVERDPQFRHLLADEKLKAQDAESRILTMSLAAYDYSVFGNKEALKIILDQLENGQHEAYLAAFPLGFVDEWDESIPAIDRCFARADGAKGEQHSKFWIFREWLFPESFAANQKKRLAASKLDADSLRGVWKGHKDGVSVTLRFGENQGWEVQQGEKVLKSELSTMPSRSASVLDLVGPDSDGLIRKLVELNMMSREEKLVHRGTLRPGKDGTMTLYIRGFFGQVSTGYPRVNDLVLTKEAEQPKGADAGQRRQLDWSKFPHYEQPEIPFANPFVPEDAVQLAAVPNKSEADIQRLIDMIHQASVEKAAELRPLLVDEKLKASDNENGSLGFALAAYAYSVNGNKAALQQLLDAMASDPNRKAETAAWSLVYVNEWELTLETWLKHFGRFSNAEEHDLFWNVRAFLYPVDYQKFVARRLTDAKLDAASLRGVWKGSKDGVSVEILLGEKSECEVKQGNIISKQELKTVTDAIGLTVHLDAPRESDGGMAYGNLSARDAGAGTLRLQMAQRGGGRGITLVLTKQAENQNPAKPKGAAAKFTPDSLIGKWRGKVDGREMALWFRRAPGAAEVQVDLLIPGEASANWMAYTIAPDGGSVSLVLADADGKPTPFGRLFPGDAGTVRYAGVSKQGGPPEDGGIILTRDRDEPKSEPKGQEARALFDRWKRTANADGTIPGTFIGMLGAEVRAYAQAHSNQVNAQNIIKLLPRFVTSRDWTQAEAIQLLDDVAFYATEPIAMLRDSEEKSASSKPADDDAAKKPQSRKIDWSKFPSYDELANPFDPEEVTRLAAAPKRSTDDTRRLMFMLLQAAAEKRTGLKHLLKDEELKKKDDEHHSLALALAAYDYSLNGNKEALQFIFDELAKERIGSDAQAAVPLGFIDEWDLTMSAHEKHFARTDGAGSLAKIIFWEQRQYLYPESFARFKNERVAAAKLDAESLRGVWKGSKDGVSVELRLGDNQGWEVRQGDKLIKVDLTTHAWETGKAVTLMASRASKGRVPCGQLWRGDDGTLRLSLWPDTSETTAYPRVSDIVLEKQAGDATRKAGDAPPPPGLSPAFTSDRAVKAEANTFRLSGNVRLRTDSLAVDADEMTVVPAGSGEKDAEKHKGIGTLTARGSVRVMFKDEAGKVTFAQGGLFDWNASTGEVVLKELTVLQAGEKLFTGTKPSSTIWFNLIRQEFRMGGLEMRVTGQTFTADQFPKTSSERIPDPSDAPGLQPYTLAQAGNDIAPLNKYARAHFERWQKYARENGDIPGGLIATLDRSITFTGDPKIKEWRKRLDGSRDWPAREAAAFLDEVAATGNWDDDEGVLAVVENCDVTQSGKPLPAELASLAWGNAGETFHGAPTSGDLRAAITLEPSAASYAQGTQLPVTVHYHNAGPAPLVFPLGMRTTDIAEARDEQGLSVFAHWTNPGMQNSDRRHSVRLEPGHWIAVSGALLTLAPGHYAETPDSHGIVMLTRPGSTVRLRWLACTTTWVEVNGGQIPWKDIVAGSIGRFSPMPKSRADREILIRRVTFGLTGQEATAADVAAFAADDSPDAITKLTARLQSLSLPARFVGWLRTGEQIFKVTPATTEYRGTVMTATGPGMYEVDGPLIMRHSGDGGSFEFVPSLPTLHPPLVFAVKDAGNRKIPHGIVWRHGSRIVWVAEKDRVRKLDLTVPGKLTETELPAGLDSIPEDLRAALVKAFPAVETAEAQDAPPAPEKPETTGQRRKIDWSQFPTYSGPEVPFANPFVPEDAVRLAAAPNKSKKDIKRLEQMVLQAAVEKAAELRPLLKDEELKRSDHSLALALSAYDYSVNGNKAALQYVLDEMAVEDHDRAERAAWTLRWIDEWELTRAAYDKHFSRIAGSVAEEYGLFWEQREFLFPEGYARAHAKELEAAKMDAASLRGVWKGSRDGVSVELRLGDRNEWEITRGEKSFSKAKLRTHSMSDTVELHILNETKNDFPFTYAWLKPGDDDTLRLHLYQGRISPDEPEVTELVITKQNAQPEVPEPPKTAPPASGRPQGAASDVAPGPKLDAATEAQLDWGEAVNGLRGAVVVRSPAAGEPQGIYLAVQNVSQAPLRFVDTTKAEKLRTLYLSDSEGILMGLGSDEPTQTDVQLQPREVAFLRMMPPVTEPGQQSAEPALVEGLRKDSLQTWKVVLEIEKAPEGAWKGKLTTAETRSAVGTEGPQPKTKEARALFKLWQDHARLNGNIPGGLLSRLHDKVKEFIRNNSGDASGDPYAKKMAPLEPRFDVAGDWKPADVVALMDDIAAVTTIPLETTMDHTAQHTLRHGQPLPAALANADWGEPMEGGLRMAFVLEPRAAEYHLGTEIKARVLLHNSGKEPVAFVTSSFQQPGHKAKLADGSELKLDSTFWTTRGRPEAYRLAPGEYCEVYTPGLGIGARNNDRDDWSNVRAGSWILCSEGDEVIVTPGPALLARRDEQPDNDNWWLEFITERLNRETPVPLDTKEREYLLYRVVRELFGTAPSTTEGDAFAADKSPDALKDLALLLTKHPYGTPCHGTIHAGETKFRVLPPDPDAARKPRVAVNPGRYNLGDIVRLVVTRRTDGGRIVNDGSVVYYPPGKDNVIHDLKLPDGYNTWAAAWGPNTTVLWVTQKGLLRKIDFTNPAKVEETGYEADHAAVAPIPTDLREALRSALDVTDAPNQVQEPLKPAAPAPATQTLQKPD